MKTQYRSASGRLWFEINAGTQKETFEEIATLQEVFENDTCGACGGKDIRYAVRKVTKDKKEYSYYELHCRNHECRARLAFGQSTDMQTIFPKRKDSDGNYLPNGGWTIYRKEDQQ